MAEIKLGRGKGRCIEAQPNVNENTKNLELILQMEILDPNDLSTVLGTMSSFLYFSTKAADWSFQRLQALGWKGKGVDDLADLSGLTEIVDIDISEDSFEGRVQRRCQIVTGGGRVQASNPIDPKDFAARAKALLGSTAPTTNSGPQAVKPPF